MIITDAYNSSAPNDVYGNSKDDISDMGNILVLNLAAQSIQATYKRYRDCKFDVRLRRISSTENLVMNLAAQTITTGLRRNLHLKRRFRKGRLDEGVVGQNESFQPQNRKVSIVLSNLKTIDLPSVLREGDNDAFIILKTFTDFQSILAPTWEYKICSKISSSLCIEWGNINVAIPLDLEDQGSKKQILRVELFYRSHAVKDQMIGECEYDLLAALAEILSKQESSPPLKAVALYLNSSNIIISRLCADKKPVVNFSLYVEPTSTPITFKRLSPSPEWNSEGDHDEIKTDVMKTQFDDKKESMPIKEKVSSKPIIAALNFAASPQRESTVIEKNITTATSFRSDGPSPRVTRDILVVSQVTSTTSEVTPTRRKGGIKTKCDKIRMSRLSLKSVSAEEGKKDISHSKISEKDVKEGSINVKQTLFDEMFNMAFRKHASIITVSMAELCIILDSLDLPINDAHLIHLSASPATSLPPTEGISPPNSSRFFGSLSLPILHTPSLAATLSQEIRDNRILDMDRLGSSPGSSVISEQQAEIIKNQLIGLVKGDYSKVKGLILKACATHDIKNGSNPVDYNSTRPSMWSQKNVQLILSTLGFESDLLSKMTGREIIDMPTDRDTLKVQYNIGASLLQKRFVIYQLTLVYIDKWWDRGMRPSEQFSKSDLEDFIRSRKSKAASTNARKLSSHNIHIADGETLLREMIQYNRAYGWSVPYGTLSYFCSRLGGKVAKVIPSASSNDESIALNNDSGCASMNNKEVSRKHNQLEGTKGCKWVRVNVELHEMLQEDHPMMDMILKSATTGNADGGIVFNDSQEASDVLALIPAACCCKYSDKVKQDLDIFEQFDQPNTLLIEAEIQIGMFASIVDYERLVRLCRRFEWWDRPSNEFLQSVGGKHVEILSVNNSASRRIGVKCLDSDVCDSLPLEAFVTLTSRNPRHANKDGDNLLKKKKKKKPKESLQPTKESNILDSSNNVISASNHIENKEREISAHSVLSNLSEDIVIADRHHGDQAVPNESNGVDMKSLQQTDPVSVPQLSNTMPPLSFQTHQESASLSSLLGAQFESKAKSPQIKMDYSWMKPTNKLDDIIPDANDKNEEKDDETIIPVTRMHFPHQKVNLTFSVTSPPFRDKFVETVAKSNPLTSKKTTVYKRPKENNETIAANIEYLPIQTKDGHVDQKCVSTNDHIHSSNNSNTIYSARPKSAPSHSKRPHTSAAVDPSMFKSDPASSSQKQQQQQLEVQGVNFFTRSGSFLVTAVPELVVSPNEGSPADTLFERQTIQDLKDNRKNSTSSNNKRPSSAGSTAKQRLRQPSQQQTEDSKSRQYLQPQLFLASSKSNDKNESMVVEETPQRKLLQKYYGVDANTTDVKIERKGGAVEAKRKKTPIRDKRREFVHQQKQKQEEANQEDNKEKKREVKYKQKETSLSQREATYKENYLIRQLKRLGVGSIET